MQDSRLTGEVGTSVSAPGSPGVVPAERRKRNAQSAPATGSKTNVKAASAITPHAGKGRLAIGRAARALSQRNRVSNHTPKASPQAVPSPQLAKGAHADRVANQQSRSQSQQQQQQQQGVPESDSSDMDDFDPDNDMYYTFAGVDEEEEIRKYSGGTVKRAAAVASAAKGFRGIAARAGKLNPGEVSRKQSPAHSGGLQVTSMAQAASAVHTALKLLRVQQGKHLEPDDPHIQPDSSKRFANPSHDTHYSSQAAEALRGQHEDRAAVPPRPKSAIRTLMLASFRERRRGSIASVSSNHSGQENEPDDGSVGALSHRSSRSAKPPKDLVARAMRVAGSAAAASARLHAAVARAERRNDLRAMKHPGRVPAPLEDFRPRRKHRWALCVGCILRCAQG